MKSVIFCWLTEITLFLHPPNQPRVTNADKSLATWGRIQGDERWWWSTWNEECHLLLALKSLYPFIPPKQPHVTNADKSLATWGRIQGDERWWWSTCNEECHLLLTHWNHFIPPSGNETQITKHIIFRAHKNLANRGRIQRDERWWWSTSKEECHLLLTQWFYFNRPLRKATENNQIHH